MSTSFRWTPEEEAWLEARIILDNGQSNTTNKAWLKSLVADFKLQFPFVPRPTSSGALETQDELKVRWNEIQRVHGLILLFHNV